MHALQKLEQRLKDVRQEVRNLVVLGMAPQLLPSELEVVRNLERSARAEVKLLLKAIDYERSRQGDTTRSPEAK